MSREVSVKGSIIAGEMRDDEGDCSGGGSQECRKIRHKGRALGCWQETLQSLLCCGHGASLKRTQRASNVGTGCSALPAASSATGGSMA